MLVSEAITLIRAGTAQDVAGQLDDTAHLLPILERHVRNWHRRLADEVPEAFTNTTAPFAIDTGANSFTAGTIAGVTSFERLVLLERVVGSSWYPVDVYADGSQELGYREEAGGLIRLMPETAAPGTYRMQWRQGVQAAAFALNTALPLPQGTEDVPIELTAAWVATRVPGDDPGPHLRYVFGSTDGKQPGMWDQHIRDLKRRGVRTQKPGFRPAGRIASGSAGTVAAQGGGGGGGGAPTDAEYIVGSANGTLTAERVLTDNSDITWDKTVAAQVKAVLAALKVKPLVGPTTLGGAQTDVTIFNSVVTPARIRIEYWGPTNSFAGLGLEIDGVAVSASHIEVTGGVGSLFGVTGANFCLGEVVIQNVVGSICMGWADHIGGGTAERRRYMSSFNKGTSNLSAQIGGGGGVILKGGAANVFQPGFTYVVYADD